MLINDTNKTWVPAFIGAIQPAPIIHSGHKEHVHSLNELPVIVRNGVVNYG
jgi:hypothetical protein